MRMPFSADCTPSPKPYLIGIAGPSCSGKTHLSKQLAQLLNANIFSLDNYYNELSDLSPEDRKKVNFDRPEALDSTLLFEHLAHLASGKAVDRPVYDFSTHSRINTIDTFHPTDFIIIEGLFALHWQQIRDLLSITIFINATDDLCLHRRKTRDVLERGRSAEYVVQQFHDMVKPMADLYIHSTRKYAQVTVEGDSNSLTTALRIIDHIKENVPSPYASLSTLSCTSPQ